MTNFPVEDIARLFGVPLHLIVKLPAWRYRRSRHPNHGFTGARHEGTAKWARRYSHRQSSRSRTVAGLAASMGEGRTSK